MHARVWRAFVCVRVECVRVRAVGVWAERVRIRRTHTFFSILAMDACCSSTMRRASARSSRPRCLLSWRADGAEDTKRSPPRAASTMALISSSAAGDGASAESPAMRATCEPRMNSEAGRRTDVGKASTVISDLVRCGVAVGGEG